MTNMCNFQILEFPCIYMHTCTVLLFFFKRDIFGSDESGSSDDVSSDGSDFSDNSQGAPIRMQVPA